MSISPELMLPFPARAVSSGHAGGCNVLSMMDDHMSSPERWATAYIARKMPVLESRRQADKESAI